MLCKGFYRNKQAGLAGLNEQINLYYRANEHLQLTRANPLVEAQIYSTTLGYPYLKCKAAATRHLVEFGLVLANRHRHGGNGFPRFSFPPRHPMRPHTDEHLRLLVEIFEGLCEFKACCEPFARDGCKRGMLKFLRSFDTSRSLWVAAHPAGQAGLPFHERQKMHMLEHLVMDQLRLWGSPHRSWCYRDEDYVGAIKNLTARTKHARTLEDRVAQKLMLLAGLEKYL
jgi:hypothetical protein